MTAIGFNAKRYFFTAQVVKDAVEEGQRKALSRVGAFIRTRARSSVKKARMKPVSDMTDAEKRRHRQNLKQAREKGKPRPKRATQPSKPGEPARSITGTYKKRIFFAYDPARHSLVVGPELFPAAKADPNALGVLEEGGQTTRTFGPNRGKQVTIKGRPTMTLALRAETQAGTIPKAFFGAVRA